MEWSVLQWTGAALAALGTTLAASAVTVRWPQPLRVPRPQVPPKPSRRPDPWSQAGLPVRRPPDELDGPVASVEGLLSALSLPAEEIAEIIEQARALTYARADLPASASFLDQALSLAQLVSPAAMISLENRQAIEDAVRLGLGEDARNLRLIWPVEREPFDERWHRAFPEPRNDHGARIARLIRCGFTSDTARAPAWVELESRPQ